MVRDFAITPALRDAIAAVRRAERRYVPGRMSSAVVEIPKLALADAVLQAVRLARVPKPRPAVATMRQAPRRRRA